MRFFFDRCMSPRLARMIDVYEEDRTIRHHDEDSRFDRKTPDTEWLAALGADNLGWVVVSGDSRILRNKAERQVLREANLTFFCMTKPWTHTPIHEYAWKFVKVWPDIVENASLSVATPKVFEVEGGRGLKVLLVGKTKD